MSLLIEVNCFLQSNREVPLSDHEGTWTPVPDFQYLVCFETCPLINCIHSTAFLKTGLINPLGANPSQGENFLSSKVALTFLAHLIHINQFPYCFHVL